MHSLQENDWVPAKVPGSVYQAYLDAGKMEDPFYRDNEEKALNLMKQDFEFATTFDAEEALREADRTVLHFDGIDTLGEIYLNGTHLGDTENMHREWEFDVKELLKAEGNELRVILRSPVNYIYDSYEKDPLSVDCSDAMKGCSRLRKAHCMFGWDWGPRLPDAGIFREVKLLGITKARFDNVRISQKHVDGQVDLALFVGTETVTESPEPFAYRVTLTTPEGKSEVYGNSPASIHVEKPELWWPNGYGKQNLYGVKIELLDGEKILDVWEKRIGLRTMTVAREKDQWGECFCHEVNGVRIFAMGADYIPEDNVLPRVTPERTRQLLTDARDCHFNCIRVWGGGYYPDDFFYDICDELGLIVWQDFMFACCSYDLTKEFEATITAGVHRQCEAYPSSRISGPLVRKQRDGDVYRRRYRGLGARSPPSSAITSKCTSTSFRRCWRSTIPIPSTGPPAPPQAAVSMHPMMRTAVMFITGMYGMETSRSRSSGNSISAISPSLVSSPSRP